MSRPLTPNHLKEGLQLCITSTALDIEEFGLG